MSFSTVLKQLREARNLSQNELAESLGISRSAVSMYENGNREPSFQLLNAIVDFFNVDISYLMDRKPAQIDSDIWEVRDTLHRRPEMRVLFEAIKDAPKEDIEKAVKIIEALKSDN